MSIDADFRIEKVANPVHPEHSTAPRPGFEPGSRAYHKALYG